jgi:hypothetical protein
VAAGDSLPIISALFGRSDSATTSRYAHLSADPLKAAADCIAGAIAKAMQGHEHSRGFIVDTII